MAEKEAIARGVTALKEAEARAAKALADADADRTKLNKVVEELQVSSHATEAEARVREAEEDRDGLATSLNQVTADHLWMREHGIGHVSTWYLFHPYVCLC
ncbi:hypothetical protein Hanom_Chr01g00055851 [Helianthus anomalus]